MNRFDAPDYLRLNGGSRYRMMRLKDRVIAHNTNRPPSTQWPTWREARQWNLCNWADAHGALGQGFNTENAGTSYERKTPIWYCHTGEQFRNEQYVDELNNSPIDHRGWYSNADNSEKVRGVVAQLTHGRWLAGYEMSMNDQRVYFDKVFDNADDAARWADGEAETAAENMKEYDERWQAAHSLNDECTEIAERVAGLYPARNASEYARDELREAIGDLRPKRETLANDFAEFKGEF